MALGVILVLGLSLRLLGVRFGLPAVYNPDEIAIMSRALAFGTGDPNPHNFLYPTFYFYVLFAWIGGYFVVERATDGIASLAQFQQQFFTDPTGIYVAGRLLGVLCGVLTIAATYLVARRLFGRATALVAALFIAVSPFHVRDSHYVKHDVPVTLAICLAYVAITRIWPERDKPVGTREAVVAGAACGVAFSTHYYAIFLALPLVLSVWYRWQTSRVTAVRLVQAGAASAATFFLLSPFLLVEPLTAWRDITANRQIVVDRAAELGGRAFASAPEYLAMLWAAMGWPVALLAIAGGLWMIAKEVRKAALLLVFVVPFLLFISNTVAASRYLNPVLPVLAVVAAYGVVRIGETLLARRTSAIALIAVAASVPAFAASLRTGFFFRQTDTRTLAQQFIESHISSGSTIAVQPYSVQMRQSRASLVEALSRHVGDLQRAPTKFRLRLALPAATAPEYRTIYIGDGGLDEDKIYVSYEELGGDVGLQALRRLGVQYVVVKRYNRSDPVTLPFLAALGREALRIDVASPYRPDLAPGTISGVDPFLHNTDAWITPALERPGPIVEVWRLDEHNPPAP